MDVTTAQFFPNVVLNIVDGHGNPGVVDGAPMWASSDETVLLVIPAIDGLSAVVNTVAPGTARITVSADADIGAGVLPITGVSEDIVVSVDPLSLASVITLQLGEPSIK